MAQIDMVISRTGVTCAVSVCQNHTTVKFQSMQDMHRGHVSKESDEIEIGRKNRLAYQDRKLPRCVTQTQMLGSTMKLTTLHYSGKLSGVCVAGKQWKAQAM